MKCKFLLLMCATMMLASCVETNLDEMKIDGSVSSQALAQKPVMVHSAEVAIPGEIIVKFRESAIEQVESATALMTEGTIATGVEDIDLFCKNVGAYKIERLFPDAGRFEARQRKAGLHLWYKISFDEGVSMSKVGQMLTGINELAVVEYNVEISLPKVTMGRVAAEVEQVLASDDAPFNDPNFEKQWHFQNNGTDWKKSNGDPYIKGAVKGADVNVVPAWEKCTGSDKVIVSVVDGVVDHDHEDLAGNIWYNEAEKNGTDGVDDDGNGYVDDVYGYNFYSNKGFSAMKNPTAATGANHGTHCAGVIAAMNNNGKGVSGIAGGTDTKNGVLIMSCATMSDEGTGRGADVAAKAITYGCNNGAVISQNSWGFTNSNINWNSDQFSSLRTAIEYFSDYAGMDESGEVQVGPMKGGLVIFAASNEGYYEGDIKKYPAADENVVAVASIAADYRPAYYTNYGTWVDISAPGGDPFFSDLANPYAGPYGYGSSTAEVYSTVVNSYDYMSGTSMACPHVSGVVALALSYADERGVDITAAKMKEYLYETARDIESYLKDDDYKYLPTNEGTYYMYMKDYRGKMGHGLVDADKLLTKIEGETPLPDDHVSPEAPGAFEQTAATMTSATIEWTVTGDYTGAPVNNYRVYWSTGKISISESGNVTSTGTLYGPSTVTVGEKSIGDKISAKINKLRPQTTYNVALLAVDDWNKASTSGSQGTVTTNDPTAPKAVTDLSVDNSTYTSLTISFTGIADCIGENIAKYTIKHSTSSSMASAVTTTVTVESGVRKSVELSGLANNTTYYIEVVATDQFGLSSEAAKVSGKTKNNLPPVLTAVGETSKTLQYWDKASIEFNAEEPNGDKWSAKIVGSVDSYVKLATEGNKVTVTFTGNSQNLNSRTYSAKVVVTDETGLTSAQVPFTFTIIGNEAPVATQIPDVYMGATGLTQSYDLASYFTDANNEPLNYDPKPSSTSTVVARIDNGKLIVSGSKYGLVDVTVTARDAGNKTASTTFKVMVRDDNKAVELYPNPVVSDMNVRMGQNVKGTIGIRIFNAAGPMVLETTATIDPFAPAKVDLSSLGAGNYAVEVSFGGEVYKSTIVKK